MKINEKIGSDKPVNLTKYMLIISLLILVMIQGMFCQKKSKQEQNGKVDQQVEQAKELEKMERDKNILEQKTADWLVYRNEEFGYQLKYPNGWKIIEADSNYKGRDYYKKLTEEQLQKVTFFERDLELGEPNKVIGILGIIVNANAENDDLVKWVKEWDNENIISIDSFNLKNIPAKIIKKFGFVETYISIRAIYNNYKLTIAYAEEPYVDKKDENIKIYEMMIETFQFIK